MSCLWLPVQVIFPSAGERYLSTALFKSIRHEAENMSIDWDINQVYLKCTAYLYALLPPEYCIDRPCTRNESLIWLRCRTRFDKKIVYGLCSHPFTLVCFLWLSFPLLLSIFSYTACQKVVPNFFSVMSKEWKHFCHAQLNQQPATNLEFVWIRFHQLLFDNAGFASLWLLLNLLFPVYRILLIVFYFH